MIPQVLWKHVLKLAHEGHQGIVKTKCRLRSKVWWPKVDADADTLCKSCHGCQAVSEYSTPEPMAQAYPPSGPWQDCAADILGPLPSGENLLVVVDYYSRYFEAVILRSTTSTKVIYSLQPIFARFGVPHTLKMDSGPQFISEESLPCGKRSRTPNNSPSVAPSEWGGRTSKPHFVESDPGSSN